MKSKFVLPVIIMSCSVLYTVYGFVAVSHPRHKIKTSEGNGFAVVELFTSEGCSSCPAADEAIERLLKKNTGGVYILAFHVDYWNRLGWTDPFSQAVYSDRQSRYANVLDLNSVYTPQVIINGAKEFVGSDEAQLAITVQNNLNTTIAQTFSVTFERNKNKLAVHYEINNADLSLLNLALVQPEATVPVKRGENGGRTLHHVNIVRLFKTIDAKSKSDIMIDLPDELMAVPLQLIAYTQDKKSFRITGAEKKAL